MINNLVIMLRPEDNVAIITKDSKFFGIFAENESQVRKNADVIQEHMALVMKEQAPRIGLWVWRICNRWKEIQGEQIYSTTKGEK